MQRARPTRMSPSRRPGSSGRNAHARASYSMSAWCLIGTDVCAVITIKNGAMIQLSKILKPIWIQSCFDRKAWCKVSYLTLHRIGYIITSKPIAVCKHAMSAGERAKKWRTCYVPIGMDTPTNLPFWSAGPVLGTKLPSRMPIIIASRIQSASKRSNQPKALKADDGSFSRAG